MGYIYIMTNPSFKEIKIGYADNVDKRVRILNTGTPTNYEVYAIYEVKDRLQDKNLHKLIDSLDPSLRFDKRKEFYSCSPHKAYELLYQIASISGTLDNLSPEDFNNTNKKETSKRISDFSFFKAKIPVGSTLQFKKNKTITVKVAEKNKVSYKGKLYSLSTLAKLLAKSKYPLSGPRFFLYEGERLCDRRQRMEEEGTYR